MAGVLNPAQVFNAGRVSVAPYFQAGMQIAKAHPYITGVLVLTACPPVQSLALDFLKFVLGDLGTWLYNAFMTALRMLRGVGKALVDEAAKAAAKLLESLGLGGLMSGAEELLKKLGMTWEDIKMVLAHALVAYGTVKVYRMLRRK